MRAFYEPILLEKYDNPARGAATWNRSGRSPPVSGPPEMLVELALRPLVDAGSQPARLQLDETISCSARSTRRRGSNGTRSS